MFATAVAVSVILGPGSNARLKPIDLKPLEKRLQVLCERFQGRMGYSLKLLKTGQQIGFRETERFPTASTIKTAVMVEAVNRVDEGTLKWSDTRPLQAANRRESSMWSFFFRDNVKLDLDGWVNLMIGVSDNTATINLRDWLTPRAINARMEKLGLKDTKILGSNPPAEKEYTRLRGMFGMGMTTPREMNRLLELIYLKKAASVAGSERMIRILGRQYWDDAIGGSVPPHVLCAHKTGAISRSRSDAAIVYSPTCPFILTIYTDNQKDRRWTNDNEGDLALAKLSSIVWNTLHPNDKYERPAGHEKFAPTGGGVSDS